MRLRRNLIMQLTKLSENHIITKTHVKYIIKVK